MQFVLLCSWLVAARAIERPAVNASSGMYYIRTDNMEGGHFFDQFMFFTGRDPTQGFVEFVDEGSAWASKMINIWANNQIYMGADTSGVSGPNGRRSVRLHSKKTYQYGLFVLDLAHVPTGCGTWPAFWLSGKNWPAEGEIDIVETIHQQSYLQSALHTSGGCEQFQEDPNSFGGNWIGDRWGGPGANCDINAPNQWHNTGCSVTAWEGGMGAPFNSAGGGVIATEWDEQGIRMWYFPRSAIPSDIQARSSPQPWTWGRPYARFELGDHCPPSHFVNNQIIFDLTFCGDWAGPNFPNWCPAAGGSCQDFVQNRPDQFGEAFWVVNYVDVYEKAFPGSRAKSTTEFHGLNRDKRGGAEQGPALAVEAPPASLQNIAYV